MTGAELLETLANARWELSQRTYGSSHATLIGLLAQWWLEIDSERHAVLDSAPSYGFKNAGWADLLLCDGESPVGVVEVEGTKPSDKIDCIANYFRSQRPELASLEFGLLLLYAYEAKGRNASRSYPSPEAPEVVKAIKDVTATNRQSLVLVVMDKRYERVTTGIRATSGYCHGAVSKVQAICFERGNEVRRRTLLEPASLRP